MGYEGSRSRQTLGFGLVRLGKLSAEGGVGALGVGDLGVGDLGVGALGVGDLAARVSYFAGTSSVRP